MAADLTLLRARHQRGMARLDLALPLLRECAEFFRPVALGALRGYALEGSKKTEQLYHGVGVKMADKLARTLHGTATSPASKWFSQKMRQKRINDIQQIKDWLEETADEMYLAINQSNHASAMGTFWGDGVALANAGIMVDEGPIPEHGGFGGFQFQNLALGSFCIERNARGVVDVLFRQLDYPVRDLPKLFPAADLGQDLTEMLRQKPDELVRCIHGTYPRSDYDRGRRGVKNMPFASVYWIEGKGGTDGIRILDESGFPEFPFAVWAWSLAAGDTWGFGPGHLALPDTKTINKNRYLRLTAAGQDALPPMLERAGMIDRLSLAPGARNIANDSAEGRTLEDIWKPMYSGAKHDVSALTDKDLERAIEDFFYNTELLLSDGPAKTAFEVARQVEEKQRLLGPTMGRLHSDVLVPMHARNFGLMWRAGAFPPPPQELLDALREQPGSVDIDVQFEGPLALAQRSLVLVAIDRANAHRLSVVNLQIAAGHDPDVIDNVDFDEQEREYAEISGEPSNIHRDPKAVATMRQLRAQAKQQAAQMQQIQQVAQAAGQAAPALTALHQASQPVGSGAPGA